MVNGECLPAGRQGETFEEFMMFPDYLKAKLEPGMTRCFKLSIGLITL